MRKQNVSWLIGLHLRSGGMRSKSIWKGRRTVNAEKHFKQRISGVHYMTPDVMSYGWIVKDKISYELADGPGLGEDERLCAVTVSRFKTNLSMAWLSKEQAEIYIRFLTARLGRKRERNQTGK